MDIKIIRPTDLTKSHIKIWRSLMDPSNATDSPFFDPQYSIVLSAFREQVRVAMVTENGKPVAFFPFEKHGLVGRPLGIKLCDYQGIVRAPDVRVDMHDFLASSNLKICFFDHMLASQPEFQKWHFRLKDSFYVDVSCGYEEYMKRQRGSGSQFIPNARRKARKLEKEVGAFRFEWNSLNDHDFQMLMEWKSAQRKRTGTLDVLRFDWVVQALRQLLKEQSEDFSGILSSLKVEGEPIAVAFGMHTRTDLHIWMVAFRHELERYSPGNLMQLALIRAAAEHGIQRVDFGKGDERYKKSLKTGGFMVAEGAVDFNPVRCLGRRFLYKSYDRVQCWPVTRFLEAPKRFVRGIERERQMSQ